MNGCQYCRTDTAGNHEDDCPMKIRKAGIAPSSVIVTDDFDGPLFVNEDMLEMIGLLKDIKGLLESIDKEVSFIRQKYVNRR